MMFEIVSIIVPVITTLIVTSVPFYKLILENKKLKIQNTKLKDELVDYTLGVQVDLEFFNTIKNVVDTILTETKVDRFLILTATNGTKDFRFATAVYEHHKKTDKVMLSIGAVGKYIRFEFDSEYRNMLKSAEQNGFVDYTTSLMPNSDLKEIYLTEEIKHSRIAFLLRGTIDKVNDRLFYCSMATHDEVSFTPRDKSIMKVQTDKLKTIFKDLKDHDFGT